MQQGANEEKVTMNIEKYKTFIAIYSGLTAGLLITVFLFNHLSLSKAIPITVLIMNPILIIQGIAINHLDGTNEKLRNFSAKVIIVMILLQLLVSLIALVDLLAVI